MSKRTDLALESVYSHTNDGIHQTTKERSGVRITHIAVTTQEAADLVGKPMGTFITLETKSLRHANPEEIEPVAAVLSDELGRLLPQHAERILVVGLGNRAVTPDALGPCVVDRVMVTNHVLPYLNTKEQRDFSAVSAVCPGVMGVTGMETLEIVTGIAERCRPDVILAVDALCAQSPERMFSTIQLTDTGIHPGSGVGNRREGLNRETLGVPVIAAGVPTVVDSDSIVYAALRDFFQSNDSLAEAQEIMEIMMQHTSDRMFVSPKEIDRLIAGTARMVAGGINLALHKNIDLHFAENFVS